MTLVFDNIFNPHNWAAVPFHFWTLVFFAFGCIVGSFLNVCIYRMPLELSVVSPPSHCPHCKYSIPFYLNVPLLTWLMLKGRCKNCGAPISPRYFFVELFTGVTFLVCWVAFGRQSPALALVYCLFLAGFIVATFIDFEHLIIPDEITLGGAVVGFLLSILLPSMHNTSSHWQSLEQSAIGIAVGAGLVYGVVRAGKLLFGKYALDLDPESRIYFTESAIVLPPKSIALERLYRRGGWFAFQASKIELLDRCLTDVEVAISESQVIIKSGDDREIFSRAAMGHLEVIFECQLTSRELARLTGVTWNAGRAFFERLVESFARRKDAKIYRGDLLVFTVAEAWLCRDEMRFEDGEIFYRKSDAISFQAREVNMTSGSWRDVPVCLTPTELTVGDARFIPEAVSYMEVVTDRMVLPREAMGLGDVKFMGAIGAFLGWEAVVFTLVVAAIIGSAYGAAMVTLRKQDWSGRIYFGPFLAAAATLWIFAGPGLVAWYLNFSNSMLMHAVGH